MIKEIQSLESQGIRVETGSINEDSRICSSDCRGGQIITDNGLGEIFCGSCGHVLEERSSETIPESYYEPTDYMAKNTAPMQSNTMFDTNVTTIISDKDGLGNLLSTKTRETFYRLKRLNNRRTGSANNQSLRSSLSLLNTMRMKLGLPDSVAENAAYMYRKARQDKIRVGMNTKNLMCACIYVACKQQGVPRSILEISFISNIRKKEISRAYRVLVERMEISLTPYTPIEFLTKIANEAEISEKSRRVAMNILLMAEKEKIIEGKNPKALAAASLYFACRLNNEEKSQDKIARASGITATTIRTRYGDLKKNILLTTIQNHRPN